jgi:hypothetical protein
MPPLPISSISAPSPTFLSPHTVLARSFKLSARSIDSPSPKRGIFAVLFSSLGPLTLLASLLSNISKAWAFIHPRHQKNLAIAQNAVNQEWWEYHSQEWRDKVLGAEFTALLTFAKQKPISYCLLVPLKVPLGSSQRTLYNGILRIADEPFYEEYKDILGEAMDEDVVRAMFEGEAGGEVTEEGSE